MNSCCCKCCEKCNPPELTAEEMHQILTMDIREFRRWPGPLLCMFGLCVAACMALPIMFLCTVAQLIVFGELR
jgi:hypothetical protein